MKCDELRLPADVLRARRKIVDTLALVGLSNIQAATLYGMSTALQWVSNDGGSALQDLLDEHAVQVRSNCESQEGISDA